MLLELWEHIEILDVFSESAICKAGSSASNCTLSRKHTKWERNIYIEMQRMFSALGYSKVDR